MKGQQQTRDLMAPKPVHPTAIRHHGMFGSTFVKQHMVIDKQWSVGDLVDEFREMASLLKKSTVFQKLENRKCRRQLYTSALNLRTQCRSGRIKLQNILRFDNVKAIRKCLLNFKGMQRLYQNMPVNMVVDNINQRTFVMRKERDRLTHRLKQLEKEYQLKLLERANIENRIRYENEFVLEEETRSHKFLENIQKSKLRLKATKTINSTYKKVIQVLRHDETFYEPILRGLSKDIDDQANFIKHILHLGTPAIAEFEKLSEEYRILEHKSNRRSHHLIHTIVSFKKIAPKQTQFKFSRANELVLNIGKHYGRETKSMVQLKHQLEDIESIIKQIKMATLCSKAKEIFPRFRSQIESNYKLLKQADIGEAYQDFLTFQEKMAAEKQNVLLHNYSEEEGKRLMRIKLLEEQIKAEDAREENMLAQLKNRADVFVILRYSLWNLADILRYVGRPIKIQSLKYPDSYLKLPLLKFEMQTMRACAPDFFEEDTKLLLTTVEKKLRTLIKSFNDLTYSQSRRDSTKSMEELWYEYHSNFLASQEEYKQNREEIEVEPLPAEEVLFEESKTLQHAPSRKQIKLQSAKIVEELSKKED